MISLASATSSALRLLCIDIDHKVNRPRVRDRLTSSRYCFPVADHIRGELGGASAFAETAPELE